MHDSISNILKDSTAIIQSTRYDGIAISKSVLQNDIVIGIGLCFFVFLFVLIAIEHNSTEKYLSLFFNQNREHNIPQQTIKDYFIRLFMCLFAVIGYSLFANCIFYKISSFTTIAMFAFVALIYIALKDAFLSIIRYTFFKNSSKYFINQYNTITFVMGYVAFIAYFTLTFLPQSTHIYTYIVFIIAYLVALFMSLYLFFTRLLYYTGVNLRFILYLCTFEILPVLVLIKAGINLQSRII